MNEILSPAQKSCRINNVDCNDRFENGLCLFHYHRERAGFTPLDAPKVVKMQAKGKVCSYSGCTGKVWALGLCGSHYRQLKRHGILEDVVKKDSYRSGCTVPDCDMKSIWGSDICARHRRYAKNYGLSDEGYVLRVSQKSCDLCGIEFQTGDRRNIDHDHSCCNRGKHGNKSPSCGECNRGVLCYKCNTGLGLFSDNPELLNKAIAYLSHYPETSGENRKSRI